MPVGPDLGLGAGAVHERVVRRDPPVVVQADDLAVVIGQILRRMGLEVPFGGDLPVADVMNRYPLPSNTSREP